MPSKETLSYKSRISQRDYCVHCNRNTEHKCFKDPNLNKWIEVCMSCDMVELADDELKKIGKSYMKASKGNKNGIT